MMDGVGVGAVVDVDDSFVVIGRRDVCLLLLHQAREDHRKQRRVGEDAERAVFLGLRHAVGIGRVALHADQDVVVVEQPVEERFRGLGLARDDRVGCAGAARSRGRCAPSP